MIIEFSLLSASLIFAIIIIIQFFIRHVLSFISKLFIITIIIIVILIIIIFQIAIAFIKHTITSFKKPKAINTHLPLPPPLLPLLPLPLPPPLPPPLNFNFPQITTYIITINTIVFIIRIIPGNSFIHPLLPLPPHHLITITIIIIHPPPPIPLLLIIHHPIQFPLLLPPPPPLPLAFVED